MKKLLESFRAPIHERVELAVKKVAEHAADASFHAQLADYYLTERNKIEPAVTVANAYEFARLFQKYQEHTDEHTIAERKRRDAKAKYDALVTSRA